MISDGAIVRLMKALMRPLTFVFVGGTCFGVQLCILLALVHFGVANPIANAIGFVSSAQLNFLLGRRLTWVDRVAGSTSMVGYHAVALLGLGVNTVAFVAADRVLGVTASAVVAGMASAISNYLLCSHVVFRRRREIAIQAPLTAQPATAEVMK
jgi:putative flippase GtrA